MYLHNKKMNAVMVAIMDNPKNIIFSFQNIANKMP